MHETEQAQDAATAPVTIDQLFDRDPPRWGLRGDVHLWRELQHTLRGVPLPASRWEFVRVVEGAWQNATTVALTDSRDPVYVERLDPGRGMSAGQVLPAWWHATGMMILLDRYFTAAGTTP